MARRTDPKDDEWQNVKDAKKRKQIQDRLAQRARRERLRAERNGSNVHSQQGNGLHRSRRCICDTHCTPTSSDSSSVLEHRSESAEESARSKSVSPIVLLPLSATNLDFSTETGHDALFLGDFSSSVINTIDPSNYSSPLRNITIPSSLPLLSPQSQPAPPLTVMSAMFLNGAILGLASSICFSSQSPPATPNTPHALHPTEMQLLVVHPRWYDRLPFPQMRDTLIRLMGFLDEEELVKDLFTMPSWRIQNSGKRGEGECVSWDPRCWVMEKEWAEKWGWLMI